MKMPTIVMVEHPPLSIVYVEERYADKNLQIALDSLFVRS